MYFDAHTHLNLDPLYEKRQQYDTAFKKVGGAGLACIGTTPENSATAVDIAQQSSIEHAIATAGIHPYEIGRSLHTEAEVDSAIKACRQLITDHPDIVCAVGECGIDAHYDNYAANKPLQIHALRQQCALAREVGLPVVVHSRDDIETTLAIIKEFPEIKRYIHCRSYPAKHLQDVLSLLPEVRIGICGHVTYDKTGDVRASAIEAWTNKRIHMVLETDAPYLTPVPHRGTLNHPAMIEHTYGYVAELCGIEALALQETAAKNWKLLYS